MLGRGASARRRISWTAVVAAVSFAPGAAPAALPNYLNQGFALEILDPSPAGDRFIVAPEATTERSFSTRVTFDTSLRPLDIRSAGTSATTDSRGEYAHVGLSASPWRFIRFSGDLPIVLHEAVFVDSPGNGLPPTVAAPTPDPGDVGDVRVGLRTNVGRVFETFAPEWAYHLALAADGWLTSGNSSTLTGEPANRVRGLLIWAGDAATPFPVTLSYSLAVGYQMFTANVPAEGHVGGIPFRAGAAIETTVECVVLRAGLEAYGTVVPPSSDPISRNTREGLVSFSIGGRRWTATLGAGAGFSGAPGVPDARFLVSLQYRAFPDEPPPAVRPSSPE